MPTTPVLKYELELWINDVMVADISKLAKNRSYVLRRNDSEELTFTLDITAFEAYCDSIGAEPQAVLEAYVTDVRVKRNGSYLFGVQVVDFNFEFGESGANVTVKCTGFLDLFKDRYVTKTYTDEDAVDIWRDLIATTQTEDALNDFGVAAGTSQYDSGYNRDRTYVDQNVKDALQNLTNLADGNFDFRFNADRTYETFQQIGSARPNNKFTYPYNVKSMTIPRTAQNLYNYIIAIGSGFGDEAIRSTAPDEVSRTNYGTRQKIVTFNSVSVQQTLDENAYAYLALVKDILQMPKLKVSGIFCDLNVIGIGDRVPVEVQGHTMMPLDETFRIEQIAVAVDDNDAEDIDLTIDNYGL